MKSAAYMDYACLGRPAARTLNAVQQAVKKMETWDRPGTLRTLEWFKEMDQAREAAALLLGVESSSVAFIANTTDGLGALAAAIPLSPADNVLVPDIDFLSSVVVWSRRQQQIGFEIRPIQTRNGIVAVEDVLRAMDQNTKAIMASAVQEVSGDRLDLQALSAICREKNIYLLIDGIQEAGVLHTNLSAVEVDAYCAGGHKWLGNPFGLGVMYIHPRFYREHSPAFLGYFQRQEPECGWEAYLQSRGRSSFKPLMPLHDARKFESGGTPHWLGAVGLKAAISTILEQGMETIEHRSRELLDHLRNNLYEIGLGEHILGANREKTVSSILTFSLPGGLDMEKQLVSKLAEENVFVSLRSVAGIGGVRVSPYYTNTKEEIDRLTEITEHLVKRRSRG